MAQGRPGFSPQKLLLLVEDNEDDIELALRELKRQQKIRNFGIVVVGDGAEALDYLLLEGERIRPSVVLLDINLPKLSGVEVLRRMRADEKTRYVPVVMFSTSDVKDIGRSYASGANSYVRKPVESGAFREVIREVTNYWLWLNSCPRPAPSRD
jgi:two-component system response regulator